ncbi:MAG: hypothetical protein AAFY55_05750 [Bacteroidota bacterium]
MRQKQDHLLFLTLTVDTILAEDDRMILSLRRQFSRCFIPRVRRRGVEVPLCYIAQVDRSPGRRYHIHALIATDVPPDVVAGCWMDSGGGIDSEVVRVGSTVNDLGRVDI